MAERRVLIDTSVWVPLLRRGPPAPLAEQVAGLTQAGRAVTAGPVKFELLRGARTDAAARQIRSRFGALLELAVTPDTWDRAGDLGFRLARRGQTVAGMDLVIAALALQHDCALLHLDSDYDRIRRVTDLKIESAA